MSQARRPLALRVASGSSGFSTSTSAVVCMSPAVTVPGPRASSRSVTGSSLSTRRTMSLKLSRMSVTSSLTPGRVVNSWRASSKRTWVTAAPGTDDKRVRRRETPRVWPNPGSSGPMAKRCRLPSSSPRGSTVGRWIMSMRGLLRSLRVQLDDERFAYRYVDVLPQRQVAYADLEALLAHLEPGRDLAAQRVHVVAYDYVVASLGRERDHVGAPQAVRRDGHPPAVDQDMAMADELAGLGAAGAPAGTEHDVVQTQLQHTQEVLAGYALLAVGLLVIGTELLLQDPVDAARLLLLPQLGEVLRALARPVPAVQAGRVRPALDRALQRVALGPLQEQLHLLPPAEPAHRAYVARHQTLRRFLGRQPLWGMGVTSLMPATSIPVLMMERTAVSRPEPGPLTSTSTLRTPCSWARRAQASAAIWAAKGVDLRDPLKPTLPAEAQAKTLPSRSVMETIVLLNELLMWATP